MNSIVNRLVETFSKWDLRFDLHSPLVWIVGAVVLFIAMVVIVSKAK